MRIRIIGVPYSWGTKELGAQRTPDALRDAGLVGWLADAGHEVEDGGDVDVPVQTEADLWDRLAAGPGVPEGDLIHLREVVSMATAVRDAVAAALDDGALPLVIGGECCLAIGALAALCDRRSAVTTAWLDAHGDINTPETSASGLITGMPFAAALGHGHPDLLAIGAGTKRPEPARTWLLGGRDLDAGEVENIADFGVRHLDVETTRALGPEEVVMRILSLRELAVLPPEALAQVAAASPEAARAATAAPRPDVYLHFDVDSLDPQDAPGVHYRVDGGLDANEVGTLAGYLCASGSVSVMAVASANLDHDIDGRTIGAVHTVLTSVADALAAVDSRA